MSGIESIERARVLRKALWDVIDVPPDKSLHQVREELILKELEAVESEAREEALQKDIHSVGRSPMECIVALSYGRCL